MNKLLLVGAGGFIGAILRYVVSGYFQQLNEDFELPYGTFAVNVIGCFIIGFATYVADMHDVFSDETRIILFTGILGSFTTFSTFGNETMTLFGQGENFHAATNVAAHIVFGLTAVWLGRSSAGLL